MNIRIVLIVVATALSSVTARAQTQQRASQLAREGRELSAPEVTDLENRLKNDPEDFATRTRLLGFYFSASERVAGADATRAARRRHILWIIEHHPEAEVTTLPEITIDPTGHPLADQDGYNEAKRLWLVQIDRHKDDGSILSHAARFFRLSDRALALDLLKQAVRLSPTDMSAGAELGYVYAITILGITMINNNGLPMNADPVAAKSALASQSIGELRSSSNFAVLRSAGGVLAQYGVMVAMASKGAIDQDALAEELLKKAETMNQTDFSPAQSLTNFYHLRWIRASTPEERASFAKKELEQAELAAIRSTANAEWHRMFLTTAAKAAIEANVVDKARQLATDALAQAGSRNDDTTGQIIHDGHVVLGRVELRSGKVEEAKAHLLLAGKVTGGGTLSSFGPNMSLAKELLERGARDTVVSYLEACESFWPNRGIVKQWIQTISAGGTPNFGANLVY